jgi:hypothetical protein
MSRTCQRVSQSARRSEGHTHGRGQTTSTLTIPSCPWHGAGVAHAKALAIKQPSSPPPPLARAVSHPASQRDACLRATQRATPSITEAIDLAARDCYKSTRSRREILTSRRQRRRPRRHSGEAAAAMAPTRAGPPFQARGRGRATHSRMTPSGTTFEGAGHRRR